MNTPMATKYELTYKFYSSPSTNTGAMNCECLTPNVYEGAAYL